MNSVKDIVLQDNNVCFYFKYLEWDSVFFNKSSYILDLDKSNLKKNEYIKNEISNRLKDSFVTVKMETSIEQTVVEFLQECGFVYIDTEVTLEKINNSYTKKLTNKNIDVIKEIENKNLPYEKLGESFFLTRFHIDLHIDNVKADALWISYLENYQLSEAKHMFSASVNEKIAGIILVNIDQEVATLFFVAVIEEFRALGIGTLLINNALKYFKDYTIRTETQVKNINALNFYISNGLSKIQKTSTVLHRW